MKKIFILYIIATGVLLSACRKSFLDLPVKNKITPEALYGDENGIKAFLASIYQQLPIEDLISKPDKVHLIPIPRVHMVANIP